MRRRTILGWIFASIFSCAVAPAACGDSNFAGDGGGDASTDVPASDASADLSITDSSVFSDSNAGDAAQGCNHDLPYGTPTVLEYQGRVPGGSNDITATLSADELTLYMSSNQASGVGAGANIYVATRKKVTDTFGALSPLAGATNFSDQFDGVTTADGLRFYFTAQPSAPWLIYEARRLTLSTSFGAPAPVAALNTAGTINYNPWIMPDGSSLYFASDRSGVSELYVAALDPDGGDISITRLDELSSGSIERNPVVTADGHTIYFGSLRAPHADGDIWVATRSSTSSKFTNLTDVAPLNTGYEDYPTWVSADDCRMLLGSLRYDTDGAIGNTVIFQASRAP